MNSLMKTKMRRSKISSLTKTSSIISLEVKTCFDCGQMFWLGYPNQERCDLCWNATIPEFDRRKRK